MNSFFTTPVSQFGHKTHTEIKVQAVQTSTNNKNFTAANAIEKRNSSFSASENDHKTFEILYDDYAAKIFGFLILHSETKEQAENYLIDIFLQVWNDIKNFNVDAEKKITKLLLVNCRPLFKNPKFNNQI